MTTEGVAFPVKQGAKATPSFWQDLPGILAYPVRHGELGLIAALSLARLLTHALGSTVSIQWLPNFAISGSTGSAYAIVLTFAIELILLVLGLKLAVEALLNTAGDRLDSTKRGPLWATDGDAAGQFFLLLVFLLPVYLIAQFFGPRPGWFSLALAMLILPAAIIVCAMEDNFWHSLDPRTWLALLARVGVDYFGVVVLAGLLGLLVFGVQSLVFSNLPGWMEAPASRFISLYALVVAYHLMGTLLHQHREPLGLDTTAPIIRPLLATREEDAIMQQSDALAADGDPVAATDVLQALIHRHGASAPIHDRYRELLSTAGDIPRLSQHARGYVATLLALGQDKRALALHVESRALDPEFNLDIPEDISRLIAHAVATGQSQLALELAAGFDTRFPRNADVPKNMLTVASLMAERFGRTQEAKEILEGLLVRYTEHPLASDITRMLAEVQLMLSIEKR